MLENPDKYVVVGNPVTHSKSPLIHQQFALQTRQNMVYERLLVELGHLPEALDNFVQNNGKGANITLPFKIDAFHYADFCTDRAKRAGAVNVFKFDEGGVCYGDNVDGIGLVRDISSNLQWPIHGKRVLLLGAGGAARGVIEPLLNEAPAEFVIANRTVEKAEQLAKEFSDVGSIMACNFTELTHPFDLIINATSASLSDETPIIPTAVLQPSSHCYDLAYSNKMTSFLQWAKAHGCENCSDGLGMLVEQAAESFYIWRGVRPYTKLILKELKDHILKL